MIVWKHEDFSREEKLGARGHQALLGRAQPCPVQICVDFVCNCIFCGVIATYLYSEIWDTQAC